MGDVIKQVDRGIPGTMRMQLFSEADAGTGDFILVEKSIGKTASRVHITATDAMVVRFNVYQHTRPIRNDVDQTNISPWNKGGVNPALIQQYISDGNPDIEIAAGETFKLDNDISVRDIEIVSADGVFEILVM